MPAIDENAVSKAGSTGDVSPDAEAATTIIICSSCRDASNSDDHPRPGLLLGDTVLQAAASDSLVVEQVECLANCKRRLSAALVKPDGWTYVFGDLCIDDAADLVEGARLYRDSANGLIPWRGRPECLKRGLIARIPPQPFNGRSK